jgi:septal ring-binding cell division protein DamX
MKKVIILVLVLVVISVGFYFGYLRATNTQAASETNSSTQLSSNSSTNRPAVRPGMGSRFTISDNAITKETTITVGLETTSTIFNDDGFGRKLVITPHLLSRSTVHSGTDDKQGKYLAAFKIDMKIISSRDTVVSSPSVTSFENMEFRLAVMPDTTNAINKAVSFIMNGLANMTPDNKISLYIKLSSW